MAITIDATSGGDSSNSYGTLAEANIYFESRLNSTTWDDASDDDKKKSLIQATLILDTLPFAGRKEKIYAVGDANYQRLQWPRYPDGSDQYQLGINHLFEWSGYEEWRDSSGSPVIPEKLKYSQFEEALFLLTYAVQISSQQFNNAKGLKSAKTGGVSETYGNSSGSGANQMLDVSPSALNFLYLLKCLRDYIRVDRA